MSQLRACAHRSETAARLELQCTHALVSWMEELATFLSEVIGICLYDVPQVDDGCLWVAGLSFAVSWSLLTSRTPTVFL